MAQSSSNNDESNDDFKIVLKKNHRRICRFIPKPISVERLNFITFDDIDKDSAKRRILDAKQDIFESDFYASLIAVLREGLDLIGKPEIKEIVCYGLGHIGESMISRYQLALLICLRDYFKTITHVYDPIFSDIEEQILTELDFTLITINEEGKRRIIPDVPTILFLPHCEKQLTNNFLYTNWSPKNLKDCIIIGNSFNTIVESTPKTCLSDEAPLILKIAPYVDEFPVINTFKYHDIFNDTSVHVFQEDKLRLIDPDFWILCNEPVFKIQSIKNNQTILKQIEHIRIN